MNKLALVLAACLSLTTGTASAHHKPWHQVPPGHLKKQAPATEQAPAPRHEDVCLVTTLDPDDPYAEIIATEWLPRPEAEEAAREEGGFIILKPGLDSGADCRGLLWDD